MDSEAPAGLTTLESLGGMLFLTVESAALGLLVYGLTRFAWLAVRLENLRGELARKAVAGDGCGWRAIPMTSSASACPRSR